MQVDRRAMEEAVRHVLMPVWNSWYFLALYANAAGDLTGLPCGAVTNSDIGTMNCTASGGNLSADPLFTWKVYDVVGL